MPLALVEGADALLVLATVMVAGVGLGAVAKRIGLPRVTGQILAGVAIGGAGLQLFDTEAIHKLLPLEEFALGLMGVTVGAHLNLRRLRNAGKRLVWLLVLEATVTPLIVFGAVRWMPGVSLDAAVLLAALAVSTAPATIVAVVKESHARGVFVKTLIAAVALNNMACIFLFEVARAWTRAEEGLSGGLISASSQLVGALLLGASMGALTTFLTERATRADRVATTGMLALLFTYGAALHFDVSPLLACVFLGAFQTNATPKREKVLDNVFSSFEPAILAVFFTLAGMSLSLDALAHAGTVAFVFFGARCVGKITAAGVAMKLAGAPRKVRRYLGIALVPQAGLAIGLVILLESDPAFADRQELLQLFVAVVLAAVTMAEVVGPILTRLGLSAAGEVDKDRVRLIDFLQEENIVTGLSGASKEQVMERLTDLLLSSHHLRDVDRDTLLASVGEREAQVSTCLGGGLFVPHGILPEGTERMYGVMGISSDGLGWDTPDGRPVHCAVLLATPPEQRQRHLEVLATLARVVGRDPVIQDRLFHCKSPAHAYEILHGDEAEGFNYFLDDDDDVDESPGSRE